MAYNLENDDIQLRLLDENEDGSEYEIINTSTNRIVGIIFTINDNLGNHIAYEIKKEYRGHGLATKALQLVLKRVNNPVLEIVHSNIPSIRVAEKAGFTITHESDDNFFVFRHNSDENIFERVTPKR